MNPVNVRTPTQQMKVREAYLANLELEQKNLKKTEDAIKSLKLTGQVALAPQDTRSLNEKLMDIEKLKISLRRELSDITDGSNVSAIINALSDQELQGLSLVSGDVIPIMKKTYLRGVPAPIFIEYIRRYLKDYSTNLGLASGNQNAVVSELKLTRDMLQRTMPSPPILDELIATIQSAPPSAEKETAMQAAVALARALPKMDDIAAAQSSLSQVELSNLSKLITDALETVPSGAQVQKLTKDIINVLRGGSEKASSDILKKTIQTIKIQQDELDQLQSISEAIKQEQAESLIPQVEGLQVPESEVFKIARLIGSKMKNVQVPTGGVKVTRYGKEVPEVRVERQLVPKRTITQEAQNIARQILQLEMMSADEIAATKFTKSALIGFWDYITKRDMGNELTEQEQADFKAMSKGQLTQLIIDMKFGNDPTKEMEAVIRRAGAQMQPPLKRDIIQKAIFDAQNKALMSENEFETLSEDEQLQYMARLDLMGLFDGDLELKRLFEAFRDQVGLAGLGKMPLTDIGRMYTKIKTVTGMGLSKAKRRSRAQSIVYGGSLTRSQSKPKRTFTEKIDFSEGFPADKSYVPFGRYVVHKHKLSGGILQVRTIKGGAIPKLPTLGISPSLGGIIKKMMGGALPSYDEMSSLTEDDKNTLYKVFKLSQIDKADLLPSPDKTKEEQEMNRFQILKGQIQAGNDSAELIKEFKCLLMKFISGGKIPRGQGMDIICDLLALGY